MARFRIVQKPSPSDPSQPVYLAQMKRIWWWRELRRFPRIAAAELYIQELIARQEKESVKFQVVREYD